MDNQVTVPQAPQQSTGGISPIAVNAAKAIRQVESGGNYSATSKDGSFGAYQFLQPTWNDASQKYLGTVIPWKSATREQQNEVAVKSINDMIQSGQAKNIGEVASIWNSGRPDTYLKGLSGTNSSGVHYDVAQYATKVANAYQKIKGQSGQSAGPVSVPNAPEAPQPINLSQQNQDTAGQGQSPTLGQDLSGRLQDAASGLQTIAQGTGHGTGLFSGALQIGGALAGGLGDIVNKGLELIPGVKQVENLVGQGAGKLLQTPVGQSVAKAIQSFSTAHPELSKDIGAGFNIATAIPIVSGLGAAGSVVKDALAQSLKGVAEKSVQSGLEGTIGKAGLKGGMFLADNPTLASDMVEQRALPKVVGGKYNSLPAIMDSQERISQLGNQVKTTLNDTKYLKPIGDSTPILEKAVSAFPNSDFTTEDMINNAKNLTPQNSKLWTKFANGDANLKEINTLRSDLDKAVKSVYTSTSEPPIKKEMGASLAGTLRQYVQSTAEETQGPFAGMAKEYRIQKALGYLHNKTVNTGLAGAAEKAAGTVEGEIIGAAHGMPLVGGFIGRQAGGLVAKRLAGIPEAILERTGKGAIKTSLKEAAIRAGKGALGALAQKAS